MNIERLFKIHERIESETTGTPEEFAAELGIKKKQLQNQIVELRLFEAKVKYSRTRKTYYYTEPFEFFDKIDLVRLFETMSKKTFIELLKIHLGIVSK